jgi:hypothetical protein
MGPKSINSVLIAAIIILLIQPLLVFKLAKRTFTEAFNRFIQERVARACRNLSDEVLSLKHDLLQRFEGIDSLP